MLAGKALEFTLWRKLLSIHEQEIEVRWEGAKEVQNIVASVISNNALTLDRGAQLHSLVFLIQNTVSLDLKITGRIKQKKKL